MSEKIKYLRQTNLTQVLGEGFAYLYEAKPRFPIKFLAQYLKNHVDKNNKNNELVKKIEYNQQIKNQLKKEQKIKEQQKENKIKIQQELEQKIQMFKSDIKENRNHEEILIRFCQWIENFYSLTGVYLGEMMKQTRNINLLQEDSITAHLEQQLPNIIKFIAASHSHHKLMMNRKFTLESIIGQLILGKNEDEQNKQIQQQIKQDGQQNVKKKQYQKIYIKQVSLNKQLKFFKYPKLGSFYAISIKLKYYLDEKLFDINLQKVENYKKLLQQYQKQYQQRQIKYKQQYQQKINLGLDEKQLQQFQKNYQQQQSKIIKPKLQQFQYKIKNIILCCDTLGLDKQILNKQQQQIKQLFLLLKYSWQQSQQNYLNQDINLYIKLYQNSQILQNQLFNRLIQQQNNQLSLNQQVQKYKNNQKLAQLELNTLKLDKLKQYMLDQKYLPYLDTLLKMNILKYSDIMERFFIFMQYQKNNINFKGTNVLNWKLCKKIIVKKNILQKIKKYNPRGAKNTLKVQTYAQWPRIIAALQIYQQNTVASYNIYLAFILRFLQIAGKIRIADRQARIATMLSEKKAREERIKQKQEKQNERNEKLQAAKMQAEEKEEKEEEFDEEGWVLTYMQSNPFPEIGQQIPNEIDGDLPEDLIQTTE